MPVIYHLDRGIACAKVRGPPGFKAPTYLTPIFGAIEQLDSEIGH
jgi:hypothetical protein